MEPVPNTLDPEITEADWEKSADLKAAFAVRLRDPLMRTALGLLKEHFRCVHGASTPTLVAGVDPIQGAALLNAFREGANSAIDHFLRMGRVRQQVTVATDNPNFHGDYQFQPENPTK